MELPTSQQFYERFTEAARCHQAEIVQLDHGVSIARLGTGTRFAVVSGLHGDEPSGPLAILRWFEETPPGSLTPEGQSLWVAPLVNTLGWDATNRTWTWGEVEKDLNRSFAAEHAPDFLKILMGDLADPLPALYLDLHEDYRMEAPYYFIYVHDTHDFSQRLAQAHAADLVEWQAYDEWHGASETYIRQLGCAHATTTEAPGAWSVEQRTDWQLKTILWCQDHLFDFAVAQ